MVTRVSKEKNKGRSEEEHRQGFGVCRKGCHENKNEDGCG